MTVKGQQTIYDTAVVCDAMVDLSSAVVDLTKRDITAQARWFNELITELVDQTMSTMRQSSVLKIGDGDAAAKGT